MWEMVGLPLALAVVSYACSCKIPDISELDPIERVAFLLTLVMVEFTVWTRFLSDRALMRRLGT
jgi:hypothetical protein